jgi:acetyl esterase/lipase
MISVMRVAAGCARLGAAGLAAAWLLAAVAPVRAADAGAAPEVVRIWPGAPPGTEDWTGPEIDTSLPFFNGQTIPMVGNVTMPTLTIYRPTPGTANGTAMVVVPGGGFQTLAIGHEGEMVARWLAERGLTAFVLKYRVRSIPGFKMPANLQKHPERFAEFARTFDSGRPIAIADATQAMRFLRAHAARYAIATDRIGMIGFSAGAITTMGVVVNAAPAERPDFVAPIYGALIDDKPPPAGGPPLFIAVTQDDAAVPAEQSVNIYARWTAAGLPAELHVYERGGHGFGMMKRGLPVDGWRDAFEAWLKSHGWLSPARKL